VPEGDQDHGRVAVTVAVALGGLDQTSDLGDGQVFSGAELVVRTLPGATVRFIGVTSLRCDFAMEISSPRTATVRGF
jgi:hypothetical protein